MDARNWRSLEFRIMHREKRGSKKHRFSSRPADYVKISAQQFRDARVFSGLDREQVAILVGVSLRTIGHWETGRTRPSFAAFKLLRVYRHGDLIDPAWSGYCLRRGRLVTPEGHAFEPADMAWLSLLVRRAAAFSELRRGRDRASSADTAAATRGENGASATVPPGGVAAGAAVSCASSCFAGAPLAAGSPAGLVSQSSGELLSVESISGAMPESVDRMSSDRILFGCPTTVFSPVGPVDTRKGPSSNTGQNSTPSAQSEVFDARLEGPECSSLGRSQSRGVRLRRWSRYQPERFGRRRCSRVLGRTPLRAPVGGSAGLAVCTDRGAPGVSSGARDATAGHSGEAAFWSSGRGAAERPVQVSQRSKSQELQLWPSAGVLGPPPVELRPGGVA